jgi:uncharacterized protein (DUF433 family)
MIMNIRPVQEIVGGELYEFYPLGDYVVAAPGVCGGRPTFKYTRLEVSVILSRLAAGDTIDEIVQIYSQSRLTPAAVKEAIKLADNAFVLSVETLHSNTV